MVRAAKTTSQVLLHMAVAFVVMWGATGSPTFGGVAALVEPLCNVALAPLHEKAWRRLEQALARGRGGRLQQQAG